MADHYEKRDEEEDEDEIGEQVIIQLNLIAFFFLTNP